MCLYFAQSIKLHLRIAVYRVITVHTLLVFIILIT